MIVGDKYLENFNFTLIVHQNCGMILNVKLEMSSENQNIRTFEEPNNKGR